MVLNQPRFQPVLQREQDDTARGLKAAIEKLNDGPLGNEALPFLPIKVFQSQWVAGGAILSSTPVFHVTEKLLLDRVALTVGGNLAASAVDYRDFTVFRTRGGNVSDTLATASTKNASITANVPFEFTLNTNALTCLVDDQINIVIAGAGALPAVRGGNLMLYFEKVV